MHRTVQPFTLPPIGKDATEAFEDVGHSDEARALLPGMLIGEFEKGANVSPTGPTFPVIFTYVQVNMLTSCTSGKKCKVVPIYCCCRYYGECCRADVQVRPSVASCHTAWLTHNFSVFYFVPLAAIVAYFAWRFYS